MGYQSKYEIDDPCESDAILQWNIRGILSNYEELKHLIQTHNPLIICLQETKVAFNKLPDIRGYSKVEQDHEAEGIAIYVKSGVPHSPIALESDLRVAAVKATLNNKPISICSLHIQPDYKLTVRELKSLYAQLPSPCLMLGDYNGHSPLS